MNNNIKKSKRSIFKLLTLGLILLLVFTYGMEYKTSADVGNINRYSDSSSSSSSSSYSSSSYRNSNSSSGESMTGTELIIVVVLVIVFLVLKKKGVLDKFSAVSSMQTVTMNNDSTNTIVARIREKDPDFSASAFESFAREVFIKLQEAWTARQWKTIRPFESNELFNLHQTQLDEYIRLGKINVMEKISVEKIILMDYSIDGNKEKLTIALSATLRDYVINDQTRAVIEGDPNKDWHMNYKMTFIRTLGVLTKKSESGETSVTNCPNCGAPTEVTSSGQCEYCKSVITTGDHGWVLSELSSLR